MEYNISHGQRHPATAFTISIHLLLALSKYIIFTIILKIARYSFNSSDRNSFYNMMLSLMDVNKAIIDRLSYIIMPITISGSFDPNMCMTEYMYIDLMILFG